ncbi:MAG: hypothetical protein IKD04_06130 [Clostridia bacterium]|nr:hypothetical protein [Clostridia bacterium]
MTVSKINSEAIRVVLTHTEVLSCFGTYERLFLMNDGTKQVLTALLRDIISENRDIYQNRKILARVKAQRDNGCEIVLSALSVGEARMAKEYVASFPDSESLTQALLMLYSCRTLCTESSLYKCDCGYRLILSSCDEAVGLLLNEFCHAVSCSALEAEAVREYCKLIAENGVIQRYGAAFKGI